MIRSAGDTTQRLRGADAAANADSAELLSTLTYRSRALQPMPELELYRLLRSAQARNRAEGITGLLVYDDGYFLQWLEGPAAGLARVWASVSRDPRHTALEVLGHRPTGTRLFAGWDMKLALRHAARDDVPAGSDDISAELLDSLCRDPEAAPSLFARPALRPVAPSVLLDVVQTVLIPRLAALHAAKPRLLAVAHPRVAELSRLLIAADPHAAAALVGQLYDGAASMAPLCASLFEPTARSLGDLWQADDCSEFDVTLGLCRLQTAIRQLGAGATRSHLLGLPAVLVVPQPGEPHLLGAALDSELLWRAGWDMHAEFPATDAALETLLAGTWFDALDLSLSAAFRREHWLPRLADTIAHARSASRNPALVVVVGGRVFGEQGDTGAQVGADASFGSAVQAEALILGALRKGR